VRNLTHLTATWKKLKELKQINNKITTTNLPKIMEIYFNIEMM
jgi:hypothetical protein